MGIWCNCSRTSELMCQLLHIAICRWLSLTRTAISGEGIKAILTMIATTSRSWERVFIKFVVRSYSEHGWDRWWLAMMRTRIEALSERLFERTQITFLLEATKIPINMPLRSRWNITLWWCISNRCSFGLLSSALIFQLGAQRLSTFQGQSGAICCNKVYPTDKSQKPRRMRYCLSVPWALSVVWPHLDCNQFTRANASNLQHRQQAHTTCDSCILSILQRRTTKTDPHQSSSLYNLVKTRYTHLRLACWLKGIATEIRRVDARQWATQKQICSRNNEHAMKTKTQQHKWRPLMKRWS